jgi:hypothetical protein
MKIIKDSDKYGIWYYNINHISHGISIHYRFSIKRIGYSYQNQRKGFWLSNNL